MANFAVRFTMFWLGLSPGEARAIPSVFTPYSSRIFSQIRSPWKYQYAVPSISHTSRKIMQYCYALLHVTRAVYIWCTNSPPLEHKTSERELGIQRHTSRGGVGDAHATEIRPPLTFKF